MSHPPPSIWRHRVTCLLLKNASAPWGQTVAQWPLITISWVSHIQYLLACRKSQRSNPYNMVKSGLKWRRVFRRRHLGRRVTAVTCLRWPTVSLVLQCFSLTEPKMFCCEYHITLWALWKSFCTGLENEVHVHGMRSMSLVNCVIVITEQLPYLRINGIERVALNCLQNPYKIHPIAHPWTLWIDCIENWI